jgi:phytoene desaturase
VYEQAATPGGKLARYERDGYVFDLGPSLFTIPAVYRDLFLKTGGPLEEAIDLQPLDPAFRYQFDDGAQIIMPGVGPARAARAIEAGLGGDTAAQWIALIQRGSDMWALTRQSVMHSAITSLRDMLPLFKRISDITTIAPWMSLRKLGNTYIRDSRLQMILDRYATYTGSDPRKAPAALATVPYVEQEFGAWHIGGGIAQLANALYNRCLQRGVVFHFNSDVSAINVSHNRAVGITLSDGTVLSADVVVANADAQHVYQKLLPQSSSHKGAKRLRKATPSLSGFVLLLAVQGKTENLLHHNVLFPANYDDEFDSVFGVNGVKAQPVSDPTIYICAPDDPLMRPNPDSEAWFVLVNAPRHGDGTNKTFDWSNSQLSEQYAQLILDVLAKRGFDVRERLAWMEWRSPLTLQNATRAPGGSIYGTSSNGATAAFLRAANRSEVENLYLVGGSAHPGGGLPLVGMSAEIVADLIRTDQKKISKPTA